MSLDWCGCTHVRWWHQEGFCLSCSKAWLAEIRAGRAVGVACEFKLNPKLKVD